MRKLIVGILALLALGHMLAAQAAPIELSLGNQRVARAEFRPGDPAKPAVFLLHGFLQTHEFPTIDNLTEHLSGEGYTVLAPTLSLGVTHRGQGMACEALHTHTMADDVGELRTWIAWLKRHKPKGIVLVGHSFGSVELLAYLAGKPDPAVRKYVGISILEGELRLNPGARDRAMREMRQLARTGQKKMLLYPFSFCERYRATPESLLSYVEWTPERILASVARPPVPVVFIMGTQDDRLGPNWLERLAASGARTHLIQGASHFMDGQYEFDLLDHVLAELKATGSKAR